MTEQPISIANKLSLVTRQWTPHRIARFDEHQLIVAKVQGEFVWHAHSHHDEVFIPISGELLMDIEDEEPRTIRPGEVFVVPAGVRHRPRTNGEEVSILVIDPMDVEHTGGETSSLTVESYPEI